MIWNWFTKAKDTPAPAPKLQRSHPLGYVEDPTRPDVFDPALMHYPNGFVKGAPGSAGTDAQRAYRALQGRALEAALAAIATSSHASEYVLRGSVALARWFPDAARAPKDIDLVVASKTVTPADARPWIEELCTAIHARLDRRGFSPSPPIVDGIWTYERAEGRRITVPWTRDDLRGEVQVDLVFHEEIIEAPVETAFDGGRYTLKLATPAESLAWKLLWLATDMHPQGKDVYDAILLAEHTQVPRPLLARVLANADERVEPPLEAEELGAWRELESLAWIDWAHFTNAYPELVGGEGYVTQLKAALRFA
ncbi:MAG: nucleotidyl transferase AbiEii/AbiGii toxin family protein [Deltaproteobacteria bacterium]